MADKDDPTTWFPVGGGSSSSSSSAPPATKAAPASDPTTWFPVGKQEGTVTAAAPTAFDEAFGMMARPTGPTIDALAKGDVAGALAVPPGRYNATFLPITADEGTGANLTLSLPGIIRQPLQGIFGGVGNAVMVDPKTNALALSPEAQSIVPFFASPLNVRAVPPEGVITGGPQVTGVNPLSPEAAARANVRAATAPPDVRAAGPPPASPVPNAPSAPPPTPQAAAAAPQSAGAQATPTGQAGLTPGQAAAYGSTADKQWLYSSQQPGVRDTTEYFPGDIPTMAEREQTVQTARDQKTQRNISPAADQAEREFLHDRSEQRKQIFQQTAGSDATQDAAITEASTNINNSLSAAFRAGGQVNPQGIVDAIEAESRTSGGKLPPVKAAMRDVSAALQKDDGSGMETDPQAVYQVRRVINYLQSREGKQANPGYGSADVQASLARVKDAIDQAIEPAAPGFRQAISDYANAQRAIEAREFLQAEEPKLYDSLGNMNYIRFHNFMQRVVTMRDPRMPLNPAQSLTEGQMTTLKGIHDSLRRSASAEALAKARGSDTAQNLMDIARQAVTGVGGDIGAAVIGGLSHGPAGMIIGPMVKRGVGEFLTARGQARATARMRNLLQPDPTQYPTTPNPLSQAPP